MDSPNKIPLVIFVLAVTALAAFGGLYAGGMVFLIWQKIPKNMLSWHVLLDYYNAFGHAHNPALDKVFKVSFAVVAACPLIVLVGCLFVLLVKPRRKLHGEARFANRNDIVKAGLIKKSHTPPTVLLGKFNDVFLESTGNTPLFLAAPTRSGKGVGIVIPNLLHYAHSVVVLDIKLENWLVTSGFRAKHGQKCFLFAPASPDHKSHTWNFLSYVRRDPLYRVADIQAIAAILYPKNGTDSFWSDNAQALFLGLVLYLLDTPDEVCNGARVLELTAPSNGQSLDVWIKEMIEARQESAPVSSECIKALLGFAGNSDNTRAGILSSVTAPLNIFRDPITAAATSGNDIDLRLIRKQKMSIYLGIQPNDLDRYGALINLFFSQLINENTKVLPEHDPSLKYQVLLLMDEFTALGRVAVIEKAIAFISGYNLRLLIIIQNKSQLVQLYTEHGTRTILTNMGQQIIFAPRDQKDAVEYSEMLGTNTEDGQSRSKSFGSGKSGGSVSTSDQKRSLLLPQEIKAIGKAKQIIFLDDETPPILTKKIIYWSDAVFMPRVKLTPPPIKLLDVDSILRRSAGIVREVLTAEQAETIPLNQISNIAEIVAAIKDDEATRYLLDTLGADWDLLAA